MVDNLVNLCYSTVQIAPSPENSGDTMTLTPGISEFPTAPYDLTVWPAEQQPILANAEIVRVLTSTGNVITSMTRGAYGSTIINIQNGYQVAQTVTANLLGQLETSISGTVITATNRAVGIYANDYGADPTNTIDSTAAILEIQSIVGSGACNIILSPGEYKIGTSANLGTFGRNQGMVGQGSNSTSINYLGSGTCINVYDSSFNSVLSQGGKFGGFLINGTYQSNNIGMSWGNLNTARCNDIQIYNFNGPGAIGLQLKNNGGWSEEGEWTGIKLTDCTNGVIFNSGSFDYSVFQFLETQLANQNGILLMSGISLEGVRFELRGNFATGSGSNSGIVFGVDVLSSGTGTSSINGIFDIDVESDGAGVSHQTFNFGGGVSSQIMGTGIFRFNSFTTSGSLGSALFSFGGRIGDNSLGYDQGSYGSSVYGSTHFNEAGGPTNYAYNGMYIYSEVSDFQSWILNGNITIAGFYDQNPAKVQRMWLKFLQDGTGSRTVTWPANVKWAGGSHTLSTAANAVDLVEAIWLPTEAVWYCILNKGFA